MVKIYTQPNCIMCRTTERYLMNRGVEYEIRSVADDPEWREVLPDAKMAPIVITEDDAWSGFRMEKLQELARAVTGA